jgi:hypothetical protein
MTPAELDDLKSRPGNSCADVAVRMGVALRPHGRGFIGPCPICSTDLQERSATRFEIKHGGQSWVCAVCADGGDVIALVQRATSCDFRDAVEWLGGASAPDPAVTEKRKREREVEQAKREADCDRYRERERGALFDVWKRAAHPMGTPVEAYLNNRGLPVPGWPIGAARLRYVADMPYFHGESIDSAGRKSPRVVHRGGAMLAPIVRGGKFAGIHITYLKPGGAKARIVNPDSPGDLPAKKVRGSKSGGAIELVKATPPAAPARIVIGEGIETVLSVWHAFVQSEIDISTTEFWSSVDLGNLGGKASALVTHPTLTGPGGRPRRVPGPDPDLSAPGIVLPESVKDVTILGDGDSDAVTTQCAVYRGAQRFRAARADRAVKIAYALDGWDWNDLLTWDEEHVLRKMTRNGRFPDAERMLAELTCS